MEYLYFTGVQFKRKRISVQFKRDFICQRHILQIRSMQFRVIRFRRRLKERDRKFLTELNS